MASPLIGPAGGTGDSFLPATGFGPGSILIAIIGGILSAAGALARLISRRPTKPTDPPVLLLGGICLDCGASQPASPTTPSSDAAAARADGPCPTCAGRSWTVTVDTAGNTVRLGHDDDTAGTGAGHGLLFGRIVATHSHLHPAR